MPIVARARRFLATVPAAAVDCEPVAAVVGGVAGVVVAGGGVAAVGVVGFGASIPLKRSMTPPVAALVAPIIPPIRRGTRTGTDSNCQ